MMIGRSLQPAASSSRPFCSLRSRVTSGHRLSAPPHTQACRAHGSQHNDKQSSTIDVASTAALLLASAGLQLLADAPAWADVGEVVSSNPFTGPQANSLYVTGGLFAMTVPGIWSTIKRAPTASRKRKTFEVAGPKAATPVALDVHARQIFQYFKKYNYKVKETGEVITFEGLYQANRGQAAAVTFYTFAGMASVALVLSTMYPQFGNSWYLLTLVSPAAAVYYFSRGERTELFKVKMVTSDDEATADILVEGDQEEIERMAKELDLVEKGKIKIKGLLEQ